MADLTYGDLFAPAWFLTLWAGYGWLAGSRLGARRSLMARMHEYRMAWMLAMLGRENRMLDIQVVGLWGRSVAFFASTTLFIVAGLLAVLGAGEQALAVLAGLPLAEPPAIALWNLKVLLLIVIFVYAFFKFTWALRQFNYVTVLLGGAPLAPEPDAFARRFAERGAYIAGLAAAHFNQGVRAYYFGLAALSWFLHPWLFVAITVWVVLVLYRREFRSNILRTLGPHGEPLLRA